MELFRRVAASTTLLLLLMSVKGMVHGSGSGTCGCSLVWSSDSGSSDSGSSDSGSSGSGSSELCICSTNMSISHTPSGPLFSSHPLNMSTTATFMPSLPSSVVTSTAGSNPATSFSFSSMHTSQQSSPTQTISMVETAQTSASLPTPTPEPMSSVNASTTFSQPTSAEGTTLATSFGDSSIELDSISSPSLIMSLPISLSMSTVASQSLPSTAASKTATGISSSSMHTSQQSSPTQTISMVETAQTSTSLPTSTPELVSSTAGVSTLTSSYKKSSSIEQDSITPISSPSLSLPILPSIQSSLSSPATFSSSSIDTSSPAQTLSMVVATPEPVSSFNATTFSQPTAIGVTTLTSSLGDKKSSSIQQSSITLILTVSSTDVPSLSLTDLPSLSLTDLPSLSLTDLPSLSLTDLPSTGTAPSSVTSISLSPSLRQPTETSGASAPPTSSTPASTNDLPSETPREATDDDHIALKIAGIVVAAAIITILLFLITLMVIFLWQKRYRGSYKFTKHKKSITYGRSYQSEPISVHVITNDRPDKIGDTGGQIEFRQKFNNVLDGKPTGQRSEKSTKVEGKTTEV